MTSNCGIGKYYPTIGVQNSLHSCLTNNVMVRFPDIAVKIFDQLGNGDLANCRILNESLRSFIDNQKIPWIRIFQKYTASTSGFLKDWKQIIRKTPTQMVEKIAIQTEMFFKSNPERQNSNWSPHFIVADQGDFELYKYIAHKTGCINPKKFEGNLLELHDFVNARNANKNFEEITSPFEMAIIKGQMEICTFIMANKENYSAHTENGVTTLHLAARYGNFELCEYLLENISQKNPRTGDGWTPLHEAASFGYLKICSLLMAYVPDINLGNNYGVTILHVAAIFNQTDICKLLINNEVDLNVTTDFGRTALHEAAGAGALEACNLLMQNMENKVPMDFDSWTPFDLAAKHGHVRICKLFMGSLPNKYIHNIQFHRRTPLTEALKNGHLNVSKLLIDNTEDENIKNKHISSSLHLCKLFFHLPMVDWGLLKDQWPIQFWVVFFGYFSILLLITWCFVFICHILATVEMLTSS